MAPSFRGIQKSKCLPLICRGRDFNTPNLLECRRITNNDIPSRDVLGNNGTSRHDCSFAYHNSRPNECPCTYPCSLFNTNGRMGQCHESVGNIMTASAQHGLHTDRAVITYVDPVYIVDLDFRANRCVLTNTQKLRIANAYRSINIRRTR